MKYKDLTGLRLGKLTVLEPTEERNRGAVVWKCRCDCGNVITVESRRLKPGAVYSCGCELPPDLPDRDLTGIRKIRRETEIRYGAVNATAGMLRRRQEEG